MLLVSVLAVVLLINLTAPVDCDQCQSLAVINNVTGIELFICPQEKFQIRKHFINRESKQAFIALPLENKDLSSLFAALIRANNAYHAACTFGLNSVKR
jgi:hypothetical protein